MKNLILLLSALTLLTNCKKKITEPDTTYCVYKIASGAKTFYKCCDTKDEAATVSIELRNQGYDASTKESKNCDCN